MAVAVAAGKHATRTTVFAAGLVVGFTCACNAGLLLWAASGVRVVYLAKRQVFSGFCDARQAAIAIPSFVVLMVVEYEYRSGAYIRGVLLIVHTVRLVVVIVDSCLLIVLCGIVHPYKVAAMCPIRLHIL